MTAELSADVSPNARAAKGGGAGRADVAVEAAVRACFDSYEQALVAGDVPAMNAWFADDPRTIRLGIVDEQWGAVAVSEWRRTAPPVPPGRELAATDVVVWTPDMAVVTTLFRYPGSDALGRQSQLWLRTAAGWRIVHAHVSVRVEELPESR